MAGDNWREILGKLGIKVHEACDTPLLPMLEGVAFAELRDAIRARGMRVRLALWRPNEASPFQLIGGRNRCAVLAGEPDAEGKIEAAIQGAERFTGGDPKAIVRDLDVTRRHLAGEQKRAVLAELLRADPNRPNRVIAREAGVTDKTVDRARTEMVRRSEIPNVSTRTDSLGRQQPATKPPKPRRDPSEVTRLVPPPRPETAEEFRRRMREEDYERTHPPIVEPTVQAEPRSIDLGSLSVAVFKGGTKFIGGACGAISPETLRAGTKAQRCELAAKFIVDLGLTVEEVERFVNSPDGEEAAQ